jgi:diguanylate cyclase (GGDEF)-like protein
VTRLLGVPAHRWLAITLIAAATTAVYELAPHGVRLILPIVMCAAATGAALRAAGRGPIARRTWLVLALAMTCFGCFAALAALGAPQALRQAVLGAAYAPTAYAVWLLAPRGTSNRTAALLDMALILGAAAVINWQIFLQPYLQDRATTGGLGAALQPVVTLTLLPLMVRSLLSGNRRVTAYSLLLVSAVLSLLANLFLSFISLRGSVDAGPAAGILPVLSQLMVLLAALDPQAGLLAPPSRSERRHVMQTVWLAPLGLTVVTLPWIAEQVHLQADTRLTSASGAVMVSLLVGRCVIVVLASQRQAATDPLTGLSSRRAFATRLAEVATGNVGDPARGAGAAVLFVDLDNFKEINDASGHDAGDALLVEVGRRLRSLVRGGDMAARIGGDEFAILLERLPPGDTAQSVGERVAAALAQPIDIGCRIVHISASVGVVPPQPEMDGEAMLTAADIAMYVAKAAGADKSDKGQVQVFSEDLRRQVQGRRELAGELVEEINSAALSRLELHYQPIVSLEDGRPRCLEALLRWRHPTRGLLPAGAFLDLIETAEQARTLDTFVLHEALRQVGQWRRTGHALGDLAVAVNLSSAGMLRPDLVELISSALARTGVPAHQLVLEVTEHENIPDVPGVAAALHQLAAMGVHISLDDFGVGYTSLHYLERFPVGTLKVDKSFTAPDEDTSREALLRGLVSFSTSTGVIPLAEGIESSNQAALVHELGFALGQGYHFGRPMAPGQLQRWLDEQVTGPDVAPTLSAS